MYKLNIIKQTVGNHEAQLTGYLLDQSEEMAHIEERPAILILPGGGYKYTSDREAEPVAMKYLAEGYQAFVLRYTVGSDHSFYDALHDAQTAIKQMRKHAEKWHIASDQIAVIGFSAGGHLAASLATMSKKEYRPNALLLGYPCILSNRSDALAFDIPSVDEYVDEQTPETFIFSTFEDQVVPIENSLQFMLALDRYDVPFESHIMQKGGHGLSLANELTCSGRDELINDQFAEWFPLSVQWLRQVL